MCRYHPRPRMLTTAFSGFLDFPEKLTVFEHLFAVIEVIINQNYNTSCNHNNPQRLSHSCLASRLTVMSRNLLVWRRIRILSIDTLCRGVISLHQISHKPVENLRVLWGGRLDIHIDMIKYAIYTAVKAFFVVHKLLQNCWLTNHGLGHDSLKWAFFDF